MTNVGTELKLDVVIIDFTLTKVLSVKVAVSTITLFTYYFLTQWGWATHIYITIPVLCFAYRTHLCPVGYMLGNHAEPLWAYSRFTVPIRTGPVSFEHSLHSRKQNFCGSVRRPAGPDEFCSKQPGNSPAVWGPCMMTSPNGNIFRVTGHLCGEFPGPPWIPHTKASDAELWCFLWSGPE